MSKLWKSTIRKTKVDNVRFKINKCDLVLRIYRKYLKYLKNTLLAERLS